MSHEWAHIVSSVKILASSWKKKRPAWHQDARQSRKKNREEHSCASANTAASVLIYRANRPPSTSTIQPTQWLTHALTSNLPEDGSRLKEFWYFHSLFNLAIFSSNLFLCLSSFSGLHLSFIWIKYTTRLRELPRKTITPGPCFPLSNSPPFSKWFLRTLKCF